jgi:hypothetical protein
MSVDKEVELRTVADQGRMTQIAYEQVFVKLIDKEEAALVNRIEEDWKEHGMEMGLTLVAEFAALRKIKNSFTEQITKGRNALTTLEEINEQKDAELRRDREWDREGL